MKRIQEIGKREGVLTSSHGESPGRYSATKPETQEKWEKKEMALVYMWVCFPNPNTPALPSCFVILVQVQSLAHKKYLGLHDLVLQILPFSLIFCFQTLSTILSKMIN